ncbi:MAG: hypothetical protein ACSHXF_10195 [Aquaticitalea sp.]
MKNIVWIILIALFIVGCKSRNDQQFAELIQDSSEIFFQVQSTDKEDLEYYEDGIIPWISIQNSKAEIEHLIGKDQVVIHERNVLLIIDYPLNEPVEINIRSNDQKGFTRKELIEKISEEYFRIYAEEEESATTKTIPIDERKTIINRNQTDGVYGIWGHDLADLVLSSIIVTHKNGDVFLELIIES